MTRIPSISYEKVIKALQRDGWVVVRQRGSHIRLQKHLRNETLKLTIPAHRPIKRSTLSHVLKHARLSIDEFTDLLQPAISRAKELTGSRLESRSHH